MDRKAVIQSLIDKTYQELAQAEKLQARSRVSNTPNGYIHLIAWSNANLLRLLTIRFTDTYSKSKYRLKTQLDDAARSVVANIEEGYARPTTGEYLTFLGYSQASLVEVKGDIQRCRQDGLLISKPGSLIADLGIDFHQWHEALKQSTISKAPKVLQSPLSSSKGLYRNVEEFKFLYPPVDNLKSSELTYEIFIELTNKTDWHLRKLVVSLENKLNQDQKFYQVEQARIRSKLTI